MPYRQDSAATRCRNQGGIGGEARRPAAQICALIASTGSASWPVPWVAMVLHHDEQAVLIAVERALAERFGGARCTVARLMKDMG